ARFLDRMLCFDKGFAHCRRPWEVQHEAMAFGWNVGCSIASVDCGKQDLLFGRAADATAESGLVRPLSTMVAYGRVMSEPSSGGLGTPMQFSPSMDLDAAIVRRCALGADGVRGTKDDWEKCRGGHVVDIVAEGWGQGHARASALGVAGMMATLGAAANGQSEVRRPYLVEAIRGAAGELQPAVSRWGLAAPRPLGITHEAAEVILSGLSYSHRAGTARSACEQVFDARRCRDIDWLAGKTGTPSFPSDGVSLDEIARECRHRDGASRAQAAHTKTGVCSSLRPYKWYVAVYRADRGHGPWTKAVAVLTERNWLKSSGIVHGASDLGPNPSAEIALQIVGRHTGAIAGTSP
ncbi:MAG TPA: hypothetical protein VFP68_23880, partial [Burkholderiaceae bacterium]|nr:hypothetical protein [Burkholderiaceae bacterium]